MDKLHNKRYLPLIVFPVQKVLAAQSWDGCFARDIKNVDPNVLKDVATIQCLVPLFRNVIMAAVELTGVALFIMFIVGGFSFITAGGNPKQLEQAKHTLTYAIIGLVIVVAAYLIIELISVFSGVGSSINLHTFTIPGP